MRIQMFLCVLLSAACYNIEAQNFTTVKTTNDKALSAYNEGKNESSRGQSAIALGYFERAIKEDKKLIDAHLALADTYVELHNYTSAKKSFENALQLDTLYAPFAFFRLAQTEWELEDYDAAAGHLRNYLNGSSKNMKNKADARRMLESAIFAGWAVKHPVPFNPQPLGPAINTAADEYFPTLTADGETLLFTRHENGFMGDENFYRSKKVDGVWQTAEPLEGVNTSDNEGAESISPDGSWLVFTACNRVGDGSQGSCDLYWSQEKANGWSKPSPFSNTINSTSWDSQPSISADGKSIIFSSRRPGGKGKEDLWITHRKPTGKWTMPVNLGTPVNTGGVEQTPFFHADGQTMYFCSDSLPGMGGQDLFLTRLQPDSTWSKPVNLGYPINTPKDEVALTVSLDGKTAYFATNRPGSQKIDIYTFELPEFARPKPVTYAKVEVRDYTNNNPLAARLDIIDLKTGQTYVSVSTRKDGTALACLPSGVDYALRINKDHYFFHSENFNLADTATYLKPYLLKVLLQPIPDSAATPVKGAPIVLRNVFFATGSSELATSSAAELDYLVRMLQQLSYLRIQINGHTDNIGGDAANQTLSEARAKSVYNYLISKGITAQRLKYKGFGETKPLNKANDTEEGRAQNRRTEFEVW
jgi:outer membrane protein OmpA-like peptidoglycan-associated protein